MNLKPIRDQVAYFTENRQDKEGNYGSYRSFPGKRPDLYSSCDMALIRTIIQEDFSNSLSQQQRHDWIDHINSFVTRDGSYTDTFNHSKLHANGMVIGALGPLGGRQPLPVGLYKDFDTVDKVVPWLERAVDWERQWGGSHLFWGGMHCFSESSQCTPEWLDAVFHWLDENLDENTGWWRKGVPHSDRHQPLGGSVHIVPIYEHNNRPFPYPERVIDSVLAMQLPSGRWHDSNAVNIMGYLELDALYELKVMQRWAPNYRKDEIIKAVRFYGEQCARFWKEHGHTLNDGHPHWLLAAIGTWGLLQQHLPDEYPDEVNWSDIFSDPKFYQTKEVETV